MTAVPDSGETLDDRLRHLRFNPSLAVFLHYRFSCIDSDDADDFFEKLSSGTELSEGSPILALRRVLEREYMGTPGRGGTNSRGPLMKLHALTIKAWNAYRSGGTVARLGWSRGGARPESFPEAV